MKRIGMEKSNGMLLDLAGNSAVGRGFGEKEVDPMVRVRLLMMRIGFVAMMVIVGLRLFELQVVRGEELRVRSDDNRIYRRTFSAPRGVITDRRGEALVINQPVYRLLTTDEGKLLLDQKLISQQEALKREAEGDNSVVYDVGRNYVWGRYLAHVVGYVAEANQEEVAGGYTRGDLVGRAGIEKWYEDELAGRRGEELIEVNATGRVLRRIGQREAVPGVDLQLSVDVGLQEKAAELMDEKTGVIVVTDPNNGEVLAMVSMPDYDPNLFGLSDDTQQQEEEVRKNEVAGLLNDEGRPLVNRAVGGIYPPGSVFKVVPAVAGLETKKIEVDTLVEDEGVLTVDEYRYGNWFFLQYGGTDGQVDIVKALQRSNDIYFYKLGEWLGPVTLAGWASEFGLGKVTGIDLPGEVGGLVPTPAWKERVKGERWFLGNTYHMAIGQGDVLVTPLQQNQMMGVIANGGKWCRPRLVTGKGGVEEGGGGCHEVGIEEGNLEVVRKGLVAACQSGGTGVPFFDFDLGRYGEEYVEDKGVVACKTGTAQFHHPEGKTHAWFSVFAPAVNPEILVTVLVEAGGEGSQVAAPIAKEVVEWWFENR